MQGSQEIKQAVRERYGGIAREFRADSSADCCGPSCGCVDESAGVQLYADMTVAELPSEVTGLSLGCGDPVGMALLQPGQTVLDLGSGGGIDCFLAAKQVGESGHVIGVDMTPEMIDRARRNAAQLGAINVEFRLGEIEHLPVADAAVDVVISNCVINLAPDKRQVFREAYRALRPGGQLSVSDIVTQGELPEALRRDLSAWAGCIAGAVDVDEYVAGLRAAGFVDVQVTAKELASAAEVAQVGAASGVETTAASVAADPPIFSARITARKP
jgi:ubiquinone/menaquinone biosynthesis C-methylase UbiE